MVIVDHPHATALPLPGTAHRNLRTPPVSGTMLPASGFRARNPTSFDRAPSTGSDEDLRRKDGVSTTVMGAKCIWLDYTLKAYGRRVPHGFDYGAMISRNFR